MSDKTKNLSKSLAALTLIVAGSGGIAMAQSVAPAAENLAVATAIQFDEFDLSDGSGALASAGDHDHDHNTEQTLLGMTGNQFDV